MSTPILPQLPDREFPEPPLFVGQLPGPRPKARITLGAMDPYGTEGPLALTGPATAAITVAGAGYYLFNGWVYLRGFFLVEKVAEISTMAVQETVKGVGRVSMNLEQEIAITTDEVGEATRRCIRAFGASGEAAVYVAAASFTAIVAIK